MKFVPIPYQDISNNMHILLARWLQENTWSNQYQSYQYPPFNYKYINKQKDLDYLISWYIVELWHDLGAIGVPLNEFLKGFTVFIHLLFAASEDPIQDKVRPKERPLTLDVLKDLQFCRLVVQSVWVLGRQVW